MKAISIVGVTGQGEVRQPFELYISCPMLDADGARYYCNVKCSRFSKTKRILGVDENNAWHAAFLFMNAFLGSTKIYDPEGNQIELKE